MLDLQRIDIADETGRIVAWLEADGTLKLRGKLFARFHADGGIDSQFGEEAARIDAAGTLSQHTPSKLVPMGEIRNGILSERSGGVLSIENGRYHYKAKGLDRRSRLRLKNPAANRTLALLIGYLLRSSLEYEK